MVSSSKSKAFHRRQQHGAVFICARAVGMRSHRDASAWMTAGERGCEASPVSAMRVAARGAGRKAEKKPAARRKRSRPQGGKEAGRKAEKKPAARRKRSQPHGGKEDSRKAEKKTARRKRRRSRPLPPSPTSSLYWPLGQRRTKR